MSKKSWGRFLIKTLLWIVGILVVAVIGIYLYLGSLVKTAVNTFVPQITGTSASVEHVDLSLLSGQIEIRGLKIGNPKGYGSDNIFELGKIKVVFQPKTVLSDKMIIDSVLISDTKISAEMKNLYSTDNNIKAIQQNINKYTASDKKKPVTTDKKQTKETKSAKTVVIRDLTIANTGVTLGVAGKTVSMTLPTIHQTGIGEKKKESLSDTFATVLNLISVETVKNLAQMVTDLGKQGLSGATDLIKSGTDSVKDISGSAKNALSGIKDLF